MYYDMQDNSDCDDDCWPDDQPHVNSRSYSLITVGDRHTDPVYPRPELKLIDVSANGSLTNNSQLSVPTTGVVINLMQNILQGTSLSTFTGNQITVKSVSYNFAPNGYAAGDVIRVALVWDLQPNAATAAYGDVYNASFIAGGLAYAHLNFNNRQRFIILRTFVFPPPLNGASTYYTGSCPINMVTTFQDPQSTPRSPQTGALLLVCCANSAENIQGIFRIKYYDN